MRRSQLVYLVSHFICIYLLVSCIPKDIYQSNQIEKETVIGESQISDITETVNNEYADLQRNDDWKIKTIVSERHFPSNVLLRINPSGIYLLWNIDHGSFTKIDIPSDNSILPEQIIISIDGRQIAGILDKNNQVFVYSDNGVQIYDLPDHSYNSIKFSQNNQLYISVDKFELLEKGNLSKGVGFTDEFYTINLETKEVTPQTEFLPGFNLMPHNQVSFQYSSDFKYVSYFGSVNGINGIKLMDLVTDEIIVEYYDKNFKIDSSVAPGWIPYEGKISTILWNDGYREKGNFYSLSVDGEIANLTNFSNSEVMAPGQGFMLFPNWSIDGRFLIFYRETDIDTHYFPYIYDRKNDEVFQLCLPEDHLFPHYSFTWSYLPSYLITDLALVDSVNGEAETTTYKYKNISYIVDIDRKIIYEIPLEDIKNEIMKNMQIDDFDVIGLVDLELK